LTAQLFTTPCVCAPVVYVVDVVFARLRWSSLTVEADGYTATSSLPSHRADACSSAGDGVAQLTAVPIVHPEPVHEHFRTHRCARP
jgi:hypothetical protein